MSGDLRGLQSMECCCFLMQVFIDHLFQSYSLRLTLFRPWYPDKNMKIMIMMMMMMMNVIMEMARISI